MSKSLQIFLPIESSLLEKLVEAFQEEFDLFLEENFSEDELSSFEQELDSLGAVFVQPISTEITFEDFYPSIEEEQQRSFFQSCKSSILLENLPYLESSPFQVTYLQEILKKFPEALIDQGGVSELSFKDSYLRELTKLRSVDALTPPIKEVPLKTKTTFLPVEPIDFLVLDIYKELDRLSDLKLPVETLSLEHQKLLYVFKKEKADPATLYQKSGLNPKDFDDGLERLKVWLKKL